MKLFARWAGPVAIAVFAISSVVSSPAWAAAKSDDGGEKVHVVGAGQTLVKIAKRFGVTVEALREANDLAVGQKLHEGMKLVIPGDDSSDRHAKSKKKDKSSSEERGEKDRDRESKDRDSKDRDSKDERGSARDKKKDKEERDDDGPQKAGHVKIVLEGETWQGAVFERRSKVSRQAQEGFSRVLSSRAGKKHGINPRLIATIAEVSDHFGGKTIEVVSGFRPKPKGQRSGHSKHNDGSAIDFHIAGVRNNELRDFCKSLKKTGCGYYPNNTFVHIDVRDASTAWVDLSRPGEPPRYSKIEQAKHADKHGADDEEESKSTRLVRGKKH